MKFFNQDEFICKYNDSDLAIKLSPDNVLMSKKFIVDTLLDDNNLQIYDNTIEEPCLHYQEKEKLCIDAFNKMTNESRKLYKNIKNILEELD